jgi:NAD(P)-dependent dehydrogenase (short-subunit alcohol dehydrogenase family)
MKLSRTLRLIPFCGAEQAANGIVAGGGEALGVCVDIADAASVNAMLRTAVAAFGGVDVLVNNAWPVM